jgi:antitoxin MazE
MPAGCGGVESNMIATVRKWGHSLAVRIPKTVATQLDVDAGEFLTMYVEGGSIILTPTRTGPQYDLDELLAQMNPDNVHAAIETGAAVGNEFA